MSPRQGPSKQIILSAAALAPLLLLLFLASCLKTLPPSETEDRPQLREMVRFPGRSYAQVYLGPVLMSYYGTAVAVTAPVEIGEVLPEVLKVRGPMLPAEQADLFVALFHQDLHSPWEDHARDKRRGYGYTFYFVDEADKLVAFLGVSNEGHTAYTLSGDSIMLTQKGIDRLHQLWDSSVEHAAKGEF